MRKATVNIITWYMVIGAVLNIAGIYFVSQVSECGAIEAILTIVALNGIYVVLARDIATAHEIACYSKNKHKSTHAH